MAVILLFYFLQSPVFEVKNIEVNGLKTFTEEEFLNNLKPLILNNFFTGVLGFNNYLVWLKRIHYDHPAILNIDIDRAFWDKKITLNIEERQPYGVWCHLRACYWFDRGGVLFREAPLTEGFLVYKINDSAGKTNSAAAQFENISKILKILEERAIPVRDISIDRGLQELIVGTYERAKIIFSLRFDPAPTFISALDTIVKKIGFQDIEYLDLTVENRIYYR